MTTTFVRQRKPVAAFFGGVFFRIKAYIDNDPRLVKKHCAEDVRLHAKAGTWDAKQTVGVIKFNAELEVFLNDILDGDRRHDGRAYLSTIFSQQRRRIALDRLIGKVGHKLAH